MLLASRRSIRAGVELIVCGFLEGERREEIGSVTSRCVVSLRQIALQHKMGLLLLCVSECGYILSEYLSAGRRIRQNM